MYVTSFSAEVAFFHVLLGIVPRSAGVGHEDSQNETATQATYQQSQYTGYTEDDAGQDRSDDGDERRYHHLTLGTLGGDGYATGVIGFRFAGQDSLDFAELAAYLVYHVGGGTSYGIHGQTAEQEGHHGADEHARQDLRIHQRNVIVVHEIEERRVLQGDGGPAYRDFGRADAGETDTDFFDV